MSPVEEYLSCGVGVQTAALVHMAELGVVTPRPRAIIFANPGRERKKTYAHWEYLKEHTSIPCIMPSAGDLGMAILSPRISQRTGKGYIKPSIPAFFKGDGLQIKRGRGLRHCTADYKIEPATGCINRLRGGNPVKVWIGISTDEPERMKPAAKPWSEHRWPLIELGMSRDDCEQWLKDHGFVVPPRSSCIFCPFHGDDEWIDLRDNDPDEFAQAVQMERDYQKACEGVFDRVPYFHDTCVPLDKVQFEAGHGEKHMSNECEGMCGV